MWDRAWSDWATQFAVRGGRGRWVYARTRPHPLHPQHGIPVWTVVMDGQPVFMIQDTARRENQNRPPNHVALYTFPTLDEAMHCEFHLLPDMWYPMPKA